MRALDYIIVKYGLTLSQKSPTEIPNTDRNSLAKLFAELGYREGAEIGVEQGAYSEVLCKANPEASLYCIDPWQAYKGYRDHVSQEKLEGFYEVTKKRLAPYHVMFLRDFSVAASKFFADESLDFVYIDANHDLLHVIEDLTAWVPKVRLGGIVAGHDYIERKNHSYGMHVLPAVHAYTRAYQINPWFVLGAKHADSEDLRDRPRSFMWVKK